ncbi:MAG TPA: preprotein translocase subunit SecE [Terriglobia bacterium]|nr:preprotein translocase subunit SecE [Terriglobia bacterium]
MFENLKWSHIKQFFIDVRMELKKVSWPGRREVYGTTVVVLFAVFFFAFYLGLVDLILKLGENRFFGLFK